MGGVVTPSSLLYAHGRDTMIAGRWFITPHAVRRFIERYCPTLTYEQALGHLVEAALVAHRDGLYKGGPAEIWRVGPLSMVVGPPRGEWVAPQLITVLRPKKGFRR